MEDFQCCEETAETICVEQRKEVGYVLPQITVSQDLFTRRVRLGVYMACD